MQDWSSFLSDDAWIFLLGCRSVAINILLLYIGICYFCLLYIGTQELAVEILNLVLNFFIFYFFAHLHCIYYLTINWWQRFLAMPYLLYKIASYRHVHSHDFYSGNCCFRCPSCVRIWFLFLWSCSFMVVWRYGVYF